nr:hypothetical protein [Endozoicomonas sp.]
MFHTHVNGQQLGQYRTAVPTPAQEYVQTSGAGIGHSNITLAPGENTFQNSQGSLCPSERKGVAGWTIKNAENLHSLLKLSMGQTLDADAVFASVINDIAQVAVKMQKQFNQLNGSCKDGTQFQHEATSQQQTIEDFQGNCKLLAQLQAKVGHLQSANTKKDGELAGMKFDVKSLDHAVKEATAALISLRSESNVLEKRNGILQSKYDKLSEMLNEVQINCLSIQRSLDDSKKEVEGFAVYNRTLVNENKSLTEYSSALKLRKDSLIEINKGQEKEINSGGETISKLSIEVAALRECLDESEDTINIKNDMLERERVDLRSSKDQIAELKEKSNQLVWQCKEAQGRVAKLEDQLEGVSEKANQYESFNDYKCMLREMRVKLDNKQKSLDVANALVEKSDNKVLRLEARIESSVESLDLLKKQLCQVKGNLGSKHKELELLKNAYSEAEGERDNLENNLALATESIKELNGEVSRLNGELCRVNIESTDKETFKAELADAVKSLRDQKADNSLLSKELKNFIDEKNKLDQVCNELQNGNDERNELIRQQESTMVNQQAVLSEYTAKLDEAYQNSNIIKSKLEKSDRNLQRAMAMIKARSTSLNMALTLVKELIDNNEGDTNKLRLVFDTLASESDALAALDTKYDLLKTDHDELVQTTLRSDEGRNHHSFRDTRPNSTGVRLDPRDMRSISDDDGSQLEAPLEASLEAPCRSPEGRGLDSRINLSRNTPNSENFEERYQSLLNRNEDS